MSNSFRYLNSVKDPERDHLMNILRRVYLEASEGDEDKTDHDVALEILEKTKEMLPYCEYLALHHTGRNSRVRDVVRRNIEKFGIIAQAGYHVSDGRILTLEGSLLTEAHVQRRMNPGTKSGGATLEKRVNAHRAFPVTVPENEQRLGGTTYVFIAESTEPSAFDEPRRITHLESVVEIVGEWQKHNNRYSYDKSSGVFNRDRFEEDREILYREAALKNHPLGIIFFDINDLKEMNDNHGHQSGDEFIRYVAQGINNSLRRIDDRIYRYGGDELVLTMPGATQEWLTDFVGTPTEPGPLRQSIVKSVDAFKKKHSIYRILLQPVAIGYGELHHYLQTETKARPGDFVSFIDKIMYNDKMTCKAMGKADAPW